MSNDTVGQTTLESLTEDRNPPIKCAWRQRPACGRCGVWLSRFEVDGSGHANSLTESKCAPRCRNPQTPVVYIQP